jgi:hypothetical protein
LAGSVDHEVGFNASSTFAVPVVFRRAVPPRRRLPLIFVDVKRAARLLETSQCKCGYFACI